MDKRSAYPLRPEMAESLMYLYRATDDPTFLEIGAQLVDVRRIFTSVINNLKTELLPNND